MIFFVKPFFWNDILKEHIKTENQGSQSNLGNFFLGDQKAWKTTKFEALFQGLP